MKVAKPVMKDLKKIVLNAKTQNISLIKTIFV